LFEISQVWEATTAKQINVISDTEICSQIMNFSEMYRLRWYCRPFDR